MNSETTSTSTPTGAPAPSQRATPTRVLARLVVTTFATLALTVSLLGTTSVSAQADETGPAEPVRYADTYERDAEGYTMVRDLASYAYAWAAENSGRKILHIPLDRIDSRGFWMAVDGQGPGYEPSMWASTGARKMTWIYQKWGVKCRSNFEVGFNPFMNTYGCMKDHAKHEKQYPGEQATSAARECRETTHRAWAWGNKNPLADGDYQLSCVNGSLATQRYNWTTRNAGGLPSAPPHCAPWEDISSRPSGALNCWYQTYPWMTNPTPLPWVPAPDACTGAPAHANTYRHGYQFTDTPDQPAPGCDGSAPAPNCTAAVNGVHPACGGPTQFPTFTGFWDEATPADISSAAMYPPPPTYGNDGGTGDTEGVTASSTAGVTAAASGPPVSASATRTATGRDAKGYVRRRHVIRAYNRRFVAFHRVRVIHRVQRSATRRAEVMPPSVSVSRTAYCTRPTMAEAQSCAAAKARAEAEAAAEAQSQRRASQMAANQAASAAQAAAQTAATRAARATSATRAERRAAAVRAKNRARAKAQAKVSRFEASRR